MKALHIYKDENSIKEEEIASYSQLFNRLLPKDYIDFLLQFNGGAIYHPKSMSLETLPITRFFSLGDLILQEQTKVSFNDWQTLEDDENYSLQYSARNLLPIASTTYNGFIHISLDKSEYGKIYETEYHGGTGLNESRYSSFTEFLKEFSITKYEVPTPSKSYYYADHKLFEPGYFWTNENLELGFKRFKEVYEFYGSNPNLKEQEPLNTTLIQTYLTHKLIFEFLIDQGAETEGLYHHTKDFEMIQYLHNDLKIDINKPNESCNPIITWSGGHFSKWDVKFNKELFDKLLKSKLPIDYTVKDKEGRTAMQRYEILNLQYEKYWRKK